MFVFSEYVNEHDVSSEQLRPVSWWKTQLMTITRSEYRAMLFVSGAVGIMITSAKEVMFLLDFVCLYVCVSAR